MTTAHARQEWLDRCALALKAHFAATPDAPDLPTEVRVSWGFPSRKATGAKKAIGICFDREATGDKHAEVFIHPILGDWQDREMHIAATIAHELCHAALGTAIGHKAPFKRAVYAIGLDGKPTATIPGEAFKRALQGPLAALGPFPTTGLDPSKAPGKKQSTRLIKAACPLDGYTIRLTRKWIDAAGCPDCPICGTTLIADAADEPQPENGDN